MTVTERASKRRDFQAIDAAPEALVRELLKGALVALGAVRGATIMAAKCDPAVVWPDTESDPFGHLCGHGRNADMCEAYCPARIAWSAIDVLREKLTEGET